MSVRLAAIGPAAREAWREIASLDPQALVTQTPDWMACICASGRFEDATRLYDTGDGHRLVLPLARRRTPGTVSTAFSMPFGWGIGGLLSSRGRLLPDDVRGVLADPAVMRPLLLSVKPSPATADAWRASVPGDVPRLRYMSQSVDLSGGFDDVWRRGFASTVRSHCRKALRRGVTAERDDTGRLMPVFDRLYRKSVDRWARQQHEPLWLARWRARRRDPAAKFATVAAELRDACRVWIAWRDSEPIASLVVLAHGEHSLMWRAAIDKEAARGTGAQELLHQLAIEEACAAGHRMFHLGDSGPSSPLAHNKRKFGARESYYEAYRFERLPLTAADTFVRRRVKRAIGFRD